MIDDKLVSTEAKTPNGAVNPRSPPSNDNDDDLEDKYLMGEDGNELPLDTEELEQ